VVRTVAALSFTIALLSTSPAATAARNVILFIGDGMGPQQVGLLLHAARVAPMRPSALERLFDEGVMGLSLNTPHGALVTDSAAAATALACGRRTLPGMLAMDSRGRPVETVLERARAAGKATGLISTIRLTDATPAAFASHVVTRYYQRDIAVQLLENGVDVLLGGGGRYFVPKGRRVADDLPGIYVGSPGFERSNRDDDRDVLAQARAAGYRVLSTRDELLQEDGTVERKLLGLFGSDAMPYRIDQGDLPTPTPSLREMTERALAVLSRRDAGFFLMVEGAKIDWAAHANDGGTLLHELQDFDEAVAAGLDFAAGRNDTLLVATADHETGGFAFSYKAPRGEQATRTLAPGVTWNPHMDHLSLDVVRALVRQKRSFEAVLARAAGDATRLQDEVRAATEYELTAEAAVRVLASASTDGAAAFGPTADFYPYPMNVPSAVLARELAVQSGVVWSSGTHSTTPVPVVGRGPGAEGFRGIHHHVDVARRLFAAVAD